MFDVPRAESHAVRDARRSEVGVRDLLTSFRRARGRVELRGPLPEEREALRAAEHAGGAGLARSDGAAGEFTSREYPREDREPQHPALPEFRPDRHALASRELAQQRVVRADEVSEHLGGGPLPFARGREPCGVGHAVRSRKKRVDGRLVQRERLRERRADFHGDDSLPIASRS
jgi:hypothetical protein